MSAGKMLDDILRALRANSKPLADEVEKHPEVATGIVAFLEAVHTYIGFKHGVHSIKHACSNIRKGHLFPAIWDMVVADASFLFGGIVLFTGGVITSVVPIIAGPLGALGVLTIIASIVFILITIAFFVFVCVWRVFNPYEPQEIEEDAGGDERDEVE
jgi:hypothetical protein